MAINFYPGEQSFNQTPGTQVSGALGRSAKVPFAEAARKPGLFRARYDDAATLMLMVTPRLQNYAAEGVEYSMVVQDVRQKLGY